MTKENNIMAIAEITSENFERTIETNPIVILDFWAAWCGPCRNFAPIFEEVANKYADIVFGKINTEEQQELAGNFGIRSIPTIAVFREQIMIYFEAGSLSAHNLAQLIEEIRGLNMDEIREEIAIQQQDSK